MDVKTVVEAGGHGLDTMIDNVAKIRSALPEEARALADSAMGSEVASMLSVAGEKAEAAKAQAAEAAEAAKAQAAEAAESARDRAADAAEAARDRAAEVVESAQASGSRRSRIPLVLGTIAVTGASAAAAVLVWRRRQAAAAAELSGEGTWASGGDVTHIDSVTDDQSPEAMDPHLAEEIDEVADELAEDFIEAIEVEGEAAEAPKPSEPFVPGVAADQSPDTVDPGLAAGLDAVADEVSSTFIDAIEEPEK